MSQVHQFTKPTTEMKDQGNLGSIIPTCSSRDIKALASIHVVAMNEEQQSRSPMVTPRIMFGLTQLISGGNMSRLWRVNASDLDKLL